MSRRWYGWAILLAFVALCTLEAWLFLEVGKRVGLFPSIVWIFFSFLLGLVLMRVEGLRMLFLIHQQLQRGVVPAELYCVGRSLAHWLSGGVEPACGVPPSEEVIEVRAERIEKDSQPA